MTRDLTNALHALIDEQLFPLDESVTPQSDLFAEGLDSMALMQLILLLEQEFAVTIVPDDLNGGNFSTLEKMADFVSRKKS